DKRVALFDIEYKKEDGKYLFMGETNISEARKLLTEKLDSKKIDYIEQITILPDTSVDGKMYGVISNSVANLRGEGRHSAELVTQAVLGTPVKIWKRTKEWLYIQTPDGYLSWVDHGGITPMAKEEYEMWKSSEKVIYTTTSGQSYKEASLGSKPVTDLVVGAILEMEGETPDFYKVRYPDGRAAFVSKEESAVYSKWLSTLEVEQDELVNSAEKMMGLPYLWGGTSSKGVDCSGYTKTIYFMNGMIIPRDASQQIHEGKLIDSVGDFDKLAVGDLLFFGKKATDTTKERVVHVGMWIGNNEFIHASGDVHISSMDTASENYDDFNKNRYLRTKRMLGENTSGLTYLKEENIYQDLIHEDSLTK
ncbi:MAG: C40 family peptidase, partial [Gramella sp.]|nr:C40 family peptidase [Christiangramia sp.]